MIIQYKDEKLKYVCSDLQESLNKKTMFLSSSKNIKEASKWVSLHIKKLKGSSNIGKFRLNKSWRVEFEYDSKKEFLFVEEIKIVKIHNHKYRNKR